MISQLISKIFDLIILLLFISVLLTWIPNIKWNQEPFRALKSFTDMFFAPFRRIIPPIGMLDISPIVAFFVLKIIASFVVSLLIQFGL